MKYVKDVSCVGHLSSVNLVTSVRTVVIDLPVGARLHQFWKKWEALEASLKVVILLREGYTLPFLFRTNLKRSPTVISNYVNPHKNLHLLEDLHQLVQCSRTGSNSKITGLLQQTIFDTQTQQLVETYLGPEHLVHLHRFQRCKLPHTNSQSVQEVHTFSRPGSVLPVQSPTLWPLHSTNGVHSGGQRSQTDGFTEGYKDPPVPRQLVDESQVPPYLSPAYTDLGTSLSRTRSAGEQEIRSGPKTGFQLPVQPERWQGQTHTRALTGLNNQDSSNTAQSGSSCPS